MKLLVLVCLFVVFAVNQTFAVNITSNGLQRATQGDNCTLRWTVDESITSYTIYNSTNGYLNTLDRNSYQDYDSSSGVITLVLDNVQLTDAGNYSLEIVNGSNTVIDSTACLFVYGSLKGDLVLTLGSNPATEGDTVELMCNVTSTSMPVTNRPKIQYTWTISSYRYFRSRFVVLSMEDEVDGYTLNNNGRTLRISSVRHPDDQYISCNGLEEGSNPKQRAGNGDYRDRCRKLHHYYFQRYGFIYEDYEDAVARCYNYGINRHLYLSVRTPPYIYHFNPERKKFNAVIGKRVVVSFSTSANPSNTSITNLTFVNSVGILQELPPQSYAQSHEQSYTRSYDYHTRIEFNFTSMEYYGNYSITVTNEIGSTNISFEVVPEEPPDAPSNVRLKYASHCEIAIHYNLMYSNSYEHSQTVYLLIRLSEGGSTAETSSVMYHWESFNSTCSYSFTKNIKPETNYKVSVWSVNSLGSSEVVEFEVRTRKQSKLQVSPETISIEGTRAIIDFTVELGDEDVDEVVIVKALCCSEFSGKCNNYVGRYNGSQVVMYNIPDGTVYFFDLIIYSGIHNKYSYYSNAVRGIRVPRNRNKDRSQDSHLTAVPILAFLDQQCAGISDIAEEAPPQD